MLRKQQPLSSLIKIVTCATLFLGVVTQTQAADKKVDPTGTWSWPAAGKGRTITAKLKLEGEKVTGTVFFPGKGDQTTDATIEDGKLTGSEVSFKVPRELGGLKFTFHYSGKVSADIIKGKMESVHGGQTESREWEAKRQAEKKK